MPNSLRRQLADARWAFSISALVLLTAPAIAQPSADGLRQPAFGEFGFDTAGANRTVAPGESFYHFANGGWDASTNIPADRSNLTMFSRLSEQATAQTRTLIEEAARSDAPAHSAVRKIGDFYASFMDEAAIEAKGVAALQPELERIAAINDRHALAAALGATLRTDVDALNSGDVTTDRVFGLWIAEDLNEPSRYAPYLLQGGLGLPDRDYYLVDSPKFADVRRAYKQHIARMLRLAGIDDAAAKADRILAFEAKIATSHWSQVDSQDVAKSNNPWTRADFYRQAPGLDWDAYFEAAGLGHQQNFIAWQPSAIAGIARLAASQSIDVWKDYLAFRAIEHGAPNLPKVFVDEHFAFNGGVLAGAKQLRDRWKRGVDLTNRALGEAVGKLYVERHFSPETKATADAMVRHIVAAFGDRIDRLDWMSPATKARAKEKLGTLQVGIGHPLRWRDYSGLEIVRGDAFGNTERAERFEYQRNLAKLGKRVDRSEWYLVPHEVNALNSPQQNSIIFPAAILQPPFFDPSADPAVNYGAIGAVIGHEIVHSFDDLGAQFDARGKLANWWTPHDLAKFKAAGQALVAQYDSYQPLPDVPVNGELTLGENIADLAGLAIAFDGYKRSLGGPAPVIGGFTGDQRFFLGFAQVWRAKHREPALRRLLLTDPHSPGEQRSAIVRNHDAWYEAFGAKPGQSLYLAPEHRVRIW